MIDQSCSYCTSDHIDSRILSRYYIDTKNVNIIIHNSAYQSMCGRCGESDVTIMDINGLLRESAMILIYGHHRLSMKALEYLRTIAGLCIDEADAALADELNIDKESVAQLRSSLDHDAFSVDPAYDLAARKVFGHRIANTIDGAPFNVDRIPENPTALMTQAEPQLDFVFDGHDWSPLPSCDD